MQTSVNFQIAAVIVIEDESSQLLMQALRIIIEWNPDVIPKYAMVNFDEGEILSLETLFPGILVFLCDFRQRWVVKQSNNVSMIADDAKCRLRCIANSLSIDECNKAVNDFRSWEHYRGQLVGYFEKTWYPEIKRWCLAYRPDDLFQCNTNNGTEHLNES